LFRDLLAKEGFREDATCRSRRREIATFRFSETFLGIAFSQVYGYDEFRERGQRLLMRIGYARVSTDEQSPDLQLDALKKAECKRVFTDKASAAKGARPGLADAVSHLRSGDVLVIWKLDRLRRRVKGLVAFVADLQERGVQFRSLTEGIDTTTPSARLFFHVMASLAQMERELLAERTRAGLTAARRRGRVGGCKRRMTPGKVESARKLLRSGMAPREVAQNLGVSIPTLYPWVPASSR
jgi:DNA invertase Pin-like site-specific DNA recombinase